MKYTDKLVSLKEWARKDISRPWGSPNEYRVIRETEKAVYVVPVAWNYGHEPELFWAPKSAITEILGDVNCHIDD